MQFCAHCAVSYLYAVLCTLCCFLSLCSSVHTVLFPIVMQFCAHCALSYRYAVLCTLCCFLSLCSSVHTVLFPIVMQFCTHCAVSYRYAVLCTLCCFLSLRSIHSALLHLLCIFFILVTQNYLSGLCYKLIYNSLTVTIIFQLNVTHFPLPMPLYQ